MWPEIGPIPTYGVLYVLGIVVHFYVSWRVAHRLNLERRVWIAVSLCYLVGMIPAAKLLYDIRQSQFDLTVVFNLKHYLEGGLWGGLLAYLLLAIPVTLLLTGGRRTALDLIAVSVPIPWALAKLGCVLNGCCHGRPCSLPWAITFPEGVNTAPAGVPLHPTQIYEIVLMGLLILVFKVLPRERWRGTMLLWFISIYGLGRTAIDMFRGDTDRYIYVGPVTLTQIICLTTAVTSALLLLVARHQTVNAENGAIG